jgi:hypothetical protein
MRGVAGCKALCIGFQDERLCDHCRRTLNVEFGVTMEQYVARVTRISKTRATPHGNKGTLRQKHQNRTWKYMRVRPQAIGYNSRLLRLKQLAGEARWEEAERIRMVRDAEAMLPPSGQRLTWNGEKYVRTHPTGN